MISFEWLRIEGMDSFWRFPHEKIHPFRGLQETKLKDFAKAYGYILVLFPVFGGIHFIEFIRRMQLFFILISLFRRGKFERRDGDTVAVPGRLRYVIRDGSIIIGYGTGFFTTGFFSVGRQKFLIFYVEIWLLVL